MAARSLRVHCELAPVLVNRTAVYRMCCMAPTELRRRGFEVGCSALFARLSPDTAEPTTRLERKLFDRSVNWIFQAGRRRKPFLWATGLALRARNPCDVRLFFDPLYTLYYGTEPTGVVIVYDLTTLTDPEWHPASSPLYQRVFRLLAQSSCHLVASCRNTADLLRVNWGIPPSRLSVLPLGLFPPAEPASVPADEEPFLLFVGSLEDRKNVLGLMRAYAEAGVYRDHGVRLRLIGQHPDEGSPLMQLARCTPGIDVRGRTSEAELSAAYRNCLAFVYPSFCEGFGLPLLEAMARGCVCLATTHCASPEVAGDTALYVNPYSPADIARGIRRIVELSPEQRRDLGERGRSRAHEFTWARFYDGLADLLRQQAA
jgi:glycosyltransferase involved in cell wall biosynthesis